MVCCLCLEDVKGVINIFAEKGKRFDIARILGKYFWFEPTMEDPISTFICYDCLHKLMEFHQFYLKVQQAHCQYSQQHVPDTTMEKELSSEEKPEKPKKTLDYFWHENVLSYVDDEGKSKTGGNSIPFENIEIEVCESQQHENETTDTLSRSQEAEDNPESDEAVNDSENCTRLLCPHPNCDRWLKDENNLKTHIRQQHSNENKYKSYICYICDRFCKNRNSYTNHVRYAHSNKTFTCEECNKTFKKAITLREHMARHTGIKLYKCPFCTRTFNSNANMHSHKKKKHPEEWDIWRKTKQESSQKLIKSELDGTNQDSHD